MDRNIQRPTPAEWKTATDYALQLNEKMNKARSEREQGVSSTPSAPVPSDK